MGTSGGCRPVIGEVAAQKDSFPGPKGTKAHVSEASICNATHALPHSAATGIRGCAINEQADTPEYPALEESSPSVGF